MKLTLLLDPYPDTKWELAGQIGVTHAVTKIPQHPVKIKGTADVPPWEYLPLLHLKNRFSDAGIELAGLEGDQFDMQRIKLGKPGRDEDIDRFCELLRNMSRVGINLFCYNFMAQFGWLRTSISTPTRGGALTSRFDYDQVENAPVTTAGPVSVQQLWENFEYFLKKIVPVAEEYRVRLALHPDDPPLSPLRGMARIFTSVDAFTKAITMVPSPYNGITFCQATCFAMGEDPYKAATFFLEQDKLFFAHFRNIKKTKEGFMETFHDDGDIDMARMMKVYKAGGFRGPIRPDHTPTLAGETNDSPGYGMLGRLHAVGFMQGILQALQSGEEN